MKFAVNYSPQAAGLFASGVFGLDLFKCPDWPDLVDEARRHRPVYVHFDLVAGDGLKDMDWNAVDALLERTGTPYVNLHLAPRSFAEDASPTLLADRLVEDVMKMAARYGAHRVIVENVPYRPGGKVPRAAVEPDVIGRVVRETGCGFLLDVAHARIAARSLGVDERVYIEALPVAHLRELHVTGLGHDGQRLRDHMPLTEEDWARTEWVVARVADGTFGRPWVLACEYGGVGPVFEWRSDPSVMAEQFPRLCALARQA
ncbi:MAG: DUF692 family protein [Firmicutes bacterium]|nr:DUF692 family protein [Bacillota bacterium]